MRIGSRWPKILGFVVGAALLSFVILSADLATLSATLLSIGLDTLVLAMVVTSIVLVVTGVRWWLFLRATGFPHKLPQVVAIRLIGQALNTSVPGGVVGDLIQILLIGRRPRLSAPKIVSTIFADRLVGVASILVVVVVFAAFFGNRWPLLYLIALAVLIFFFLGIALLVLIGRRQSPNQFSLLARIANFTGRIVEVALRLGRSRSILPGALSLATIGQLAVSVVPWLLMRDISPAPLLYVLPVMMTVSLAALIPISISGLGIREWLMVAAMAQFGMTLEAAIAVSVAWFAITFVASWLMAGSAMLIFLIVGRGTILKKAMTRSFERPAA